MANSYKFSDFNILFKKSDNISLVAYLLPYLNKSYYYKLLLPVFFVDA